MKRYLLTCSVDAVGVDFEQEITATEEPDFWTCYEIAAAHGCEWFTLEEVEA